MLNKHLAKKKRFAVQQRNRCKVCNRPRGYMRFFMMCRICVRNFALKGLLPGVQKASW
ncbi:MAG: type Z 30S ribosomal protein S14 [Candidatus Babeliales bacterium]